MGLNYDLGAGDKSENLGRINHFEKFNKAKRIFFCRNCQIFRVLLHILALKMIWDALYCPQTHTYRGQSVLQL